MGTFFIIVRILFGRSILGELWEGRAAGAGPVKSTEYAYPELDLAPPGCPHGVRRI